MQQLELPFFTQIELLTAQYLHVEPTKVTPAQCAAMEAMLTRYNRMYGSRFSISSIAPLTYSTTGDDTRLNITQINISNYPYLTWTVS